MPPSVGPWKELFVEHLSHVGSTTEFALATVGKDGAPRVRYCIHRGFWANLPENPYNKLARNPTAYDSDCPVFTTDARMNKVAEIFASSTEDGGGYGSGGGGQVEAVYLFKHVMVQWRIRGKCWFLAADDLQDGPPEQSSAVATVKAEVGRFMRRRGGGPEPQPDAWSWLLEVENQFENLRPGMRASFRSPPPGLPIQEGQPGPGEDSDREAGHLRDEPVARKNFRVAIITPDQVEQVDLSNPDKRQRFVWTRTEDDWTTVETTA